LAVHIKEINVQNLGPLTNLKMKLGLVNLIYGQNEKGKTYLVEFLIRSLFKNVKEWKLRSKQGRGSVVVEGLGTEKVHFSLSPDPKLEDFWEKENVGLPLDYSRLMVVKGAEVELTSKDVPSDKAILRRYLSGQALLDEIDNRISSTIQSCQLENGTIIGHNRGELKSKDELDKKVTDLDRLFEQLDKGYSDGIRKMLSDEQGELEGRLSDLEKAKRYLAYELAQEIERLKKERQRFSEDVLQKAKENQQRIQLKNKEMERKEHEKKEAEANSRHYEYLKKAEINYTNFLNSERVQFNSIFLLLSMILTVLALVSVIVRMPIGTYITLGCAVLSGLFHLFRTRLFLKNVPAREELERLRNEFKNRFNSDLSDLTAIQEMIQKKGEEHKKAEILTEQLLYDSQELESITIQLSRQIFTLTVKQIEPENWNRTIQQIEHKLNALDSEIREKDKRLDRLNIPSSDYITENPELGYDEQLQESMQREIELKKKQLREENDKLNTLKQRICDRTGDAFDTDWESIIQHLREKRIQLNEDRKQITSEIIGKQVVHHVLEDLRKEEDMKIVEGLKSPYILDPLHKITRRYKGLELHEEQLVVFDDYDRFDLNDLSTGAQEQVLLALRIGFTQKLAKRDESLFLILDDAFQYSDWERRDGLVDMMIHLAKKDWQIIYFTMDDHIRDLFDKKGKTFGDQYRYVELVE